MNEELKPCPFCGGEALLENTITQASIMCCDCPAVMRRGHTTRSFDDGTQRAITAWNTRTTDARITSLEEEVGALRTLLEWYADQMCEGLCEKDPRLAERIGCENCAGCPARATLSIRGEG